MFAIGLSETKCLQGKERLNILMSWLLFLKLRIKLGYGATIAQL